MLSAFTDRLRAFVHRRLDATGKEGPVVGRVLEVVNTVNDLLSQPIRGADGRRGPRGSGAAAATGAPTASGQAPVQAPVQTPVIVYFDGKDHRTKTKVEELLRGREIAFQLLDVTNDEAERSWVITAARREEFPIVVIAGTPVGGFDELTQLDVQGQLKRLVFGTE
jgi:glutaredoxin